MRGELQHVCGAPVAGIAAAILKRDSGHRVIDVLLSIERAVAGQMPLADIGRLIARLFNIIGQRFDAARQHDVVAIAARIGGVAARLENRAAGAAHRLRRKGPFKAHALARHRVQARRDRQSLTIAADGVRPLLIGKVKDNVGTAGHVVSLLYIVWLYCTIPPPRCQGIAAGKSEAPRRFMS